MAIPFANIIVGDTGSGKSVLVGTWADWVWRKYQVVTRYYAFDAGGWSDELKALIALGIVEVWKPLSRDPDGSRNLASETLMRASQGWWPAEIDPATGLSPVGCALVPPGAEWRGAVAYDGITSMCDWSMSEMGNRAAEGILGGEGSNMKTVVSGELKMGSGNRASVGFTQNKCKDWVLNTLQIKGLVTSPLFTALEAKVTDNDTALQLYGPKLAGSAKTPEAPAWFGNCLGAINYKAPNTPDEWRLYLRDYYYPSSDRVPHKCKVRVAPWALPMLPEFLSDGPLIQGQKAKLEKFNLGHLFDMIDAIADETLRAKTEAYPNAPGLKASNVGSPEAVAARVAGPAAKVVLGPRRGPVGPGAAVRTVAAVPAVAVAAAPAPTQPATQQNPPAAAAAPAVPPVPTAAAAPASPAAQAPPVAGSRPSPPGAKPMPAPAGGPTRARAPIPAAAAVGPKKQ